MSAFEAAFLAIGGNAALLAILGYLGKRVLDSVMARDMKRFEGELAARSEVAIERHKSDLQLRTIEHQVRYSRLHERRAEVISELYGLLVEALWEAESFLSLAEFVGEPTKPEKYTTVRSKLVELYRYFDRHRIYLPPKQCQSLHEIIKAVRGLVTNYGMWLPREGEIFSEYEIQQHHEALTLGWNTITTQIPLARKSLEDEFRALLGATTNLQP